MDKAEYQDLLDQIQNCVNKKDYQKAYTLAKKIDWRRVKSFRTLNMIADIYEIMGQYAKAAKTYDRILDLLQQEWGLSAQTDTSVIEAQQEKARLLELA